MPAEGVRTPTSKRLASATGATKSAPKRFW